MNKFVLKDVSVFHKDAGTLLDHISFSVPEEGIFSILGETGSGKTLLVKIMVGLRPYGMKTEGEVIYYEDKSYSILKLSKKKIHLLRGSSLLWIPQNSGGALNPLLSCEKQVLLPLEKKIGLSKKEAKERIRVLFDYLGLCPTEKVLTMYPHELSGGMKVRLMIAIGIAMESKILILDEPTKGLDDELGFQLMELLHRVSKEKKMKLIIITHDLPLARKYTDACAVLYKGKLIDTGDAKKVLSKDGHPYLRALWNALPVHGMEVSMDDD